MLVTLSTVLQKAKRGNYAVGAFNVNNLEMIQAIMTAAEAEKSPVVISTSEGAIEYAGMDELGSLVHLAAERSKRPVVGKVGPEEGLLSDAKILAHLKKHKAFGPKKI